MTFMGAQTLTANEIILSTPNVLFRSDYFGLKENPSWYICTHTFGVSWSYFWNLLLWVQYHPVARSSYPVIPKLRVNIKVRSGFVFS